MPRMSRTPLNVGVVDGDGDFVIYGAGGRLVDEDFVICVYAYAPNDLL